MVVHTYTQYCAYCLPDNNNNMYMCISSYRDNNGSTDDISFLSIADRRTMRKVLSNRTIQ